MRGRGGANSSGGGGAPEADGGPPGGGDFGRGPGDRGSRGGGGGGGRWNDDRGGRGGFNSDRGFNNRWSTTSEYGRGGRGGPGGGGGSWGGSGGGGGGRWNDDRGGDRYGSRGGGGGRYDSRGGSNGGGGGGGQSEDWLSPLPRNERLEMELFGGGHGPSGINFDRYEDIPVDASGNDAPPGIEDVSVQFHRLERSLGGNNLDSFDLVLPSRADPDYCGQY